MKHIKKTESVNTGGGCYVDLLYLEDGRVIGVTDDCLVVYDSIDAFWACMEGDYSSLNSKDEILSITL